MKFKNKENKTILFKDIYPWILNYEAKQEK